MITAVVVGYVLMSLPENKPFDDSILRVKQYSKITKTANPSPQIRRSKGPIATSTKKLMSYISVRDIESETYPRGEWHRFALKELMDNAWDFLNDYYSDSPREDRFISVTVKVDWNLENEKHMLHLSVRNSNIDNISIFEDLDLVFNFDMWYSTKRYQHRETSGSLGDFLKRGLGMGYAAWTEGLNEDNSFVDEQWKEPVIVKYNGKETRVFIKVHKGSSEPMKVEFEYGPSYNDTYTEVKVALMLPKYFNDPLARQLEEYYKLYKIGKPKTDFSFTANIPIKPKC